MCIRDRVTDIDTVMIIGCGMIGMGAIVRSTLRGATVIAVDLDDEKLELAKRVGAHHTINSMKMCIRDRSSSIIIRSNLSLSTFTSCEI